MIKELLIKSYKYDFNKEITKISAWLSSEMDKYEEYAR